MIINGYNVCCHCHNPIEDPDVVPVCGACLDLVCLECARIDVGRCPIWDDFDQEIEDEIFEMAAELSPLLDDDDFDDDGSEEN